MLRGFVLIMFSLTLQASSQTLHVKDDRSKIVFGVKNFGLNVSGTLRGLSGNIVLREDSVEKSHFEATVKTETIDTGVGLRDKHLRNTNYFDVENYPVIRIASSSISRRHDQWMSEALVTIKNVTKTISIPFTVQQDKTGIILRSNFTLNRSDFGVGENSFSLNDRVEVRLEVFGEIHTPRR
jgi:polyisoprenoid-binding protein YceI